MNRDRIGGYLVSAIAGALVVVLACAGLTAVGVTLPWPARTSSPASSASIGPSARPSPGGASSASSPGASQGGEAALAAPAFQSVGPMSAPVTVQVWADFQCPFCGLFTHGLEPSLLRTHVLAGTARVVFRDFAFLGPESTTAAVAARCAGAQGAFWPFHDVLFASQQGENQGTFSDELMRQLAAYLDLDEARFAACTKDPAVAAAVGASRVEGAALGVGGTPTIRLVGPSGTYVFASMPREPDLLAAVDRMARGLPAMPPSPSPSVTVRSPAATPRLSPPPSAAESARP
jgi:protein-disulfide isomerase